MQQIRTRDMVRYIAKLPILEILRIKKGFWLTREDVELLLTKCPRLEHVNFRESGMKQNLGWARKGSKREMIETLQVMAIASEPKDSRRTEKA